MTQLPGHERVAPQLRNPALLVVRERRVIGDNDGMGGEEIDASSINFNFASSLINPFEYVSEFVIPFELVT